MAVLSVPKWRPDPVGALPAATTIEFTVIPGVLAQEGIVIEFVLHSLRAEFRDGAAPPALADDERAGSDPTTPDLVPQKRLSALIVDRYPRATPDMPLVIKRMLPLQALAGGSSGVASITVTVSDVQVGGIPTDAAVQTKLIGL